ncbi:winged helix-turn-helix transcriptional regulator [Candidatus Woesearchaeota archaeon]|nr:winged helix-turn-helix transcriptional regulator [Candidatus Woesearchaeota archaeon]
MNNKKIGITLLILSILLFSVLISYNYKLNQQSQMNGCNPNAQCMKLYSLLSITNIFIGIIFSLISLGFYIIFFSKEEEILLKRLEENKRQLTKEQKFEIMLKALKPEERQIIQIIRENEGITQVALRIKTDFSKTKLSFVLADLEKNGLIKKELFGKTNKLYIKEGILSLSKHIQG